jgi:hypothetical protein
MLQYCTLLGFRYDATQQGGTVAYDPRLDAAAATAAFNCFSVMVCCYIQNTMLQQVRVLLHSPTQHLEVRFCSLLRRHQQ